MNKPNIETIREIYNLTSAYQKTQALYVAASLDLANKIDIDQTKSVHDIAKEISVDGPVLYRFMRALAQIKFFEELELSDTVTNHGVFKHTQFSLQFRDDNIRYMVLLRGGYSQQASWFGLLNSVKTGKPNHQETIGAPDYWTYLQGHPEEEAIFNRAMTSYTVNFAPLLVKLGDFSKFDTIADLGGGQGFLLKMILEKYSNIKQAINFDLKSVVDSNVHSSDLDPRYKDQDGSFFESVPEADCYVLKSILHDWDDEHSIKIMKVIAKHIKPGGKVYVYDQLNSIKVKNEKNLTTWNDLHMLTVCGGKERNELDWEYLAKESGFKIDEVKTDPNIPQLQALHIFSKI